MADKMLSFLYYYYELKISVYHH